MPLYTVKIACERPDTFGAALSKWDCREIVRQLLAAKIVTSISRETVRRILKAVHLKPWRWHAWLSPKVPRDAAFAELVRVICDLYIRTLAATEVVLCVDEKTRLQPRKRLRETRPAGPKRPVQVEQEYIRGGALNLFAAFDTRTGKVIGWNAARKRADEFVSFLEVIDHSLAPEITSIHLVLDNLRVHKSVVAKAWLAEHPRFQLHFPPVHCSWMNQVEQWFSILQRKALAISDFENCLALDHRIHGFIARWNENAHPFNWSTKSSAKILAKCEQAEAMLADSRPTAA